MPAMFSMLFSLLSVLWSARFASPFSLFQSNRATKRLAVEVKSTADGIGSSSGGYDFGIGKNTPLHNNNETSSKAQPTDEPAGYWPMLDPVVKPKGQETMPPLTDFFESTSKSKVEFNTPKTTRRMVANDEESSTLRAALWDEGHFQKEELQLEVPAAAASISADGPPRPTTFYPDIDLSIPETVYKENEVDLVWDLLRWEAHQEAQREPLLVSFLYSSILNHPSLESSLAFMLANRLQSPAMMISTQLQSLIYNALQTSPMFRRAMRADIMACRDRDPAVNTLPDIFLYFKGFHALQSHRVANTLWSQQNKRILAQYLQAQVSQTFQIDIHPNAKFGSGIMLDHGTGIVVGETATVGHNCSILHHVTLGGSGKKGVDRHPKVGDGVLLGAGATVVGPVEIGSGSQVGAGTLVISDLPAHSVAVGVPARIIGSFKDVTEQPSIGMDQVMAENNRIIQSDGI